MSGRCSLQQAAMALAGMSVGYALSNGEPAFGGHFPRTDLSYTHTPKPLSKRAKRRLRGKGLA